MSDLFDTMLSGIPENISTKKLSTSRTLSSPILYKSKTENPVDYTFIVDSYLSSAEISLLRKFLEKKLQANFQVLYPLQIIPDLKDESKTVWKMYTEFKWNLAEYIKPWSKIISFGKSIFSICESNDLDCSVLQKEDSNKKGKAEKNSIIEGFYDTLSVESYFLDPLTKCVVHPVDSWVDMIKAGLFKDCFEFNFFKVQIERSKNYKILPQKLRKIESLEVTNSSSWFSDMMQKHTKDEILAFDLETKTLDPWNPDGKIICITFSFYNDPYTGYYIDWENVNVKELTDFLSNYKLLGTNLSYDLTWLCTHGSPLSLVKKLSYDTMHLCHLWNNLHRKSLKGNSFLFSWYGGYDKPLDDYKEKHPQCKKDYSLIPKSILLPYACQDPCMSNLVHRKLEEYVHKLDLNYPVTFIPDSKWSMWKFYTEIRIPTQRVFTKAEIIGIDLNWEKVKQVSDILKKEIAEVEDKIHTLLGTKKETFNIYSGDQMGMKLKDLGFKNYGVNKKGIYNVNDYSLQKWAEDDGEEVAKEILRLHGIATLYKTFVGSEEEGNGYWQYRKADGKIHAKFSVGLTNTGRNSSYNPNLTNVPKHGRFSKAIKDFFTPTDPNKAIIELDGHSLQLKILASLSEDKKMMELFKNDIDMHSLTAFTLFGKKGESFEDFDAKVKSKDKISVSQRSCAKAPNFSLSFNSTAYSFAFTSLYQGPYKWSLDHCKGYIEANDLEELRKEKLSVLKKPRFSHIGNPETFSYFWACGEDIKTKWLEAYSGIADLIEYKIKEGTTFGACFTPFGFIRRVPFLKWYGEDEDGGRLKNNQNIMTNVGAQTFENFLISKTLVKGDEYIEENNMNSQLFSVVHDSLVFITDYKEALNLTKYLSSVFTENIPENKDVPHRLDEELGIWGAGTGITSCSTIEEIENKVKSKMKKVREDPTYMS